MDPIQFSGDYVMRIHRALLVFFSCAIVCHAQVSKTGPALLNEVRAKYDAPFTRNLESFDCAVDFSWKEHFTVTTRVGDEGSDEELEKIFQPIQNRVAVTRQSVTVSSGMSKDAISKLPHGGMAEFLLEHAVQRGLYTWLPASANTIFPSPAFPVSVEQSSSGYKVDFKMQPFDIEMVLGPDMGLESLASKSPQTDHLEFSFVPGPQGFLLTSRTMGEDGNSDPGHRLIFTYTYQTVDGVQLPESVAIVRKSHHEVWRYRLSGCTVKASK
jgi:hypothetical protein